MTVLAQPAKSNKQQRCLQTSPVLRAGFFLYILGLDDGVGATCESKNPASCLQTIPVFRAGFFLYIFGLVDGVGATCEQNYKYAKQGK